jgi:chaperone required for assembly of F1-ATPase
MSDTTSNGNDDGDGDRKLTHRDDLERASGGPRGVISDSLKKPLPRRFYKEASVGDVAPFQILLDGRAVKTPKKRALAVPTKALAQAIAEEWQTQQEFIDPSRMPLTRFANTAIDAVCETEDAVAADIVAYAGSDLVCYRAEIPAELVALQARDWNPIVAWADATLGAKFRVVPGVMHVPQSAEALAAVAKALTPHEAFRLTGLHVLTTLMASALLALALEDGAVTADAAWKAAHVDEDYQIGLWGEDAEAVARRRGRRAEFDAAYRWLTLLRPVD